MSYTTDNWFEHYHQKYGHRSRPPEVFHIGYHKTGTTFVQKNILKCLPQEKQEKILSHEAISGWDFKDDLSCAQKIMKMNPQAKIIITIRSQISIYPSYYWLYVKRGGALSLRNFINKCLENKRFDYDAMLQHLLQNFPAERIKIIPFELIKTDKATFIESYLRFAFGSFPTQIDLKNEPKNKSPGKGVIQAICLINRTCGKSEKIRKFLMDKILFLDGFLAGSSKSSRMILTNQQIQKIKATYQISNQKLQKHVAWDLEELGYPV
ncbi:MAG: sulfotransferase [Alphaproteobacteria bacterium]|nr:sulfotransferase [Alphaproteobacteria bacterium]